MRKKLRRITRLALLAAVVGAVVALRREAARRAVRDVLGPPASWPPLQSGEAPVAAVGGLAAEPLATPVAVRAPAEAGATVSDEPVAAVGDVAADESTAWVPSADGSCPLSHPVKVSGSSAIYHLPGGAHYARTRAERCYVDAAAAEADGYRAAKSSSPGGTP
jgi:hypothetical protein